MIYYKIIQNFGQDKTDKKWKNYLHWRNLKLNSFDSIDNSLCPNLFYPNSEEDWINCVNEDNNLDLITNLQYGKKIISRYVNSRIIGIEEVQEKYSEKDSLLGYDILDQKREVSLISNWGNDIMLINKLIAKNALLATLNDARKVFEFLYLQFPTDPHVINSKIWAIYNIQDKR